MIETVGMIGLGLMGLPMAKNLLQAGFGVVGCRKQTDKLAELDALGGKGLFSAREVASQSQAVISVLPTVESLYEALLGEQGVAAGAREGLILVEASTMPLKDKQAVAQGLAQAGVVTLDCPLSGTGAQAQVKDLAVYASGDRAAYEACVPLFEGFGRAHYYLGEYGAGTKMKFVANLLVAIHNISAAEAFVLGMKAGLDPQQILEVISDGAGTSRMFEVRGPLMVAGEYEPPTMKVDIWQKDMEVIGAFAKELKVPLPLFGAAAQVYTAAMADGRAKQDTASVCAVLEHMAGYERS